MGSFCMGYSDAGANIYITLGLTALYALGATPIALALAAVAYIATGLSYAELASAYPVAGGAQSYASKAFGDFHSFGALIAYMYVNSSMIVLRVKDTSARPWKMRGNINFSKNRKKSIFLFSQFSDL